MAIELPRNIGQMIYLRQRIASQISLSPEHLDLNKDLVNESFDNDIKPLFTETERRPMLARLSRLRNGIKDTVPYPISPRYLSAIFFVNLEENKFLQAALKGLKLQDSQDNIDIINIALHIFAHNFDIASAIGAVGHRFVIVEDELNGLTSEGIDRRDQIARQAGMILPASDLAQVYGESTAYARELADLLNNEEKLATPGTILFTDLIARIESNEFVPGILPESFRELSVLAVEDAQKIHQLVYPFAEEVLKKPQ